MKIIDIYRKQVFHILIVAMLMVFFGFVAKVHAAEGMNKCSDKLYENQNAFSLNENDLVKDFSYGARAGMRWIILQRKL